MAEKIILEQFIQISPATRQKWVVRHWPETLAKAVSLADNYLTSLGLEAETPKVILAYAWLPCDLDTQIPPKVSRGTWTHNLGGGVHKRQERCLEAHTELTQRAPSSSRVTLLKGTVPIGTLNSGTNFSTGNWFASGQQGLLRRDCPFLDWPGQPITGLRRGAQGKR